MEVMKSELEIFRPRLLQNQIVSAGYRTYTPLSGLQHGAPIEFYIPPANKQYPVLSQSYVQLIAKITKLDDTAPAVDIVGPIILPVSSAFAYVEITLGSTVITDPSRMYWMRGYLKTLFTHNPDVQDTQLQMGIWYKDTPKKMTAVICATAGDNK